VFDTHGRLIQFLYFIGSLHEVYKDALLDGGNNESLHLFVQEIGRSEYDMVRAVHLFIGEMSIVYIHQE
jgi:hypothetical protein